MANYNVQEYKKSVLMVAVTLISLNPFTFGYADSTVSNENNKASMHRNKEATKIENERYLFIQFTHKAVIKKVSNDSGAFTITMYDISPYVTCFTERPAKKAALVPIEQLLKLWTVEHEDGFKKKPPNADINAIVVGSSSMEPVNLIVELVNPVYDSKAKTLTYTIHPLVGNSVNIPESATLKHVNLFIDDVCLSCFWP